MRIGFDAMGGDYAPQATILGAILAKRELSEQDRIVLFGNKDVIIEHLKLNGASVDDFDIVDAPEVIDMHDKPIKALQNKPNSSIALGFSYLKEGKIDTFSSAGNTGVMLVGTMYNVGVVEGIIRPCFAALLPKQNGGLTVMVDVGVNPDAKPEQIYQFGVLGSFYAQYSLNVENPKVGLLNIGEEEEKGNVQSQAAMQLMKGSKDFNFIGNAEPSEIFDDNFDVIVCDGFIGNLIMKQTEAFARIMVKSGVKNDFIKNCNYEIYGGLPLLGAKKVVIVAHGVSNERAIKSMLLQSKTMYESNINDHIEKVLKQNLNNL